MKYKIFLFIFMVGLVSSIILATSVSTLICTPGKGCDIVNSSVYGSTFGIKNSIYGIFIFAFLIAFTAFHIEKPNKHTRRIIHLGIIAGSLIAIYFLYLQFFVIKALCEFCLLIDFGLLISLIFMIKLWRH